MCLPIVARRLIVFELVGSFVRAVTFCFYDVCVRFFPPKIPDFNVLRFSADVKVFLPGFLWSRRLWGDSWEGQARSGGPWEGLGKVLSLLTQELLNQYRGRMKPPCCWSPRGIDMRQPPAGVRHGTAGGHQSCPLAEGALVT